MSSKTKIVVLHLKELIYTSIFVILGILLILLLIFMFLPDKNEKSYALDKPTYTSGVYSSTIELNNNTLDVEVRVDEHQINSISLINLDETVATMYPLIQPAFDELTQQIYANQNLDGITYSDANQYTSMVLLQSIETALKKAQVEP